MYQHKASTHAAYLPFWSWDVAMQGHARLPAPGYRTQKKIHHHINTVLNSHAYNLACCNMNHTAIDNAIVSTRNQPQHTHKENTALHAMVMHAGRHRITRNDIESHHHNMHPHPHAHFPTGNHDSHCHSTNQTAAQL